MYEIIYRRMNTSMLIRREDNGDISKLSKGSHRKVWFTCENCGVGVLQAYKTYLEQNGGKFCRRCRNSYTANLPEVKKKQSIKSKEKWKDSAYREKMSVLLSKACKETWDKDDGTRRASIWNKTPYIEVKSTIEDEGYTLLTDEDDYNTVGNGIIVSCPKGHVFETHMSRWNVGHRCLICSGYKKYTVDEIRSIMSKEGYSLISDTYKDSMALLKMLCPEGHEFEMRWNNFNIHGQRCPKCRVVPFKEILDSFKIEGYKVITNEEDYVSAKSTVIKCECPEGHIYDVHYLSWKRGNGRCIQCIKNQREAKYREMLSKEGYELIWADGKKFKFICPEGHVHKMFWSNWILGQGCGKCYQERRERDAIRYLKGYKLYYYNVKRLTEINYKKYKSIINPRNLPRGRNEYHLDHKFSIYEGFRRGILPYIIASVNNLEMLMESENISKSKSCSITEKQLIDGLHSPPILL
jgi:hypothetical protein